MKQLVKIFFLFLFFLAGCNRGNIVTTELFNPNPLLTPDDVYSLDLPRIQGIDIDMFQIFNEDTTICIETAFDMVFSQSWLFSIDSIITLDDIEFFFKNQYDIITLSKDTIININQEEKIIFKAYSKRNNFYFQYEFTDLRYHIEDKKGKAVYISYTFPKYEKYLNKFNAGK